MAPILLLISSKYIGGISMKSMKTNNSKKRWNKPKLIVIFSGNINEHVMVVQVSGAKQQQPPYD